MHKRQNAESISRELHDEVGQALGLLLMEVGRLSNQLASSDEKRERCLTTSNGGGTGGTDRAHMALLLRPSMLDDLGLVPAVEWYAREAFAASRHRGQGPCGKRFGKAADEVESMRVPGDFKRR